MSYSSLAAALGLSHTSAIPSIQSLLNVTQDLPMSWRKHILQTCRIQTLQSAHHLSTRLNSLQPTHVATSVQDREISKQDLADMLDLLYGSPLLYSLLSFWTRGESMHPLIARDEIEQAIKKELSASQQEDRNQVLDYDIFVGAGSRRPSLHMYKVDTVLVQLVFRLIYVPCRIISNMGRCRGY